jgi:hypothetical protein
MKIILWLDITGTYCSKLQFTWVEKWSLFSCLSLLILLESKYTVVVSRKDTMISLKYEYEHFNDTRKSISRLDKTMIMKRKEVVGLYIAI